MKGVTVKQLRVLASAILEKVDNLLKGEPARLIGYGAAVIIAIVAKVLSDRGYVRFSGIGFDDALGLSLGAIAVTVTVVESIRKFVYSPQTYIEDLADEWSAGHEQAHFEEKVAEYLKSRQEQLEAQQPKTTTMTVGSAKATGTGDKSN